MNRPRNNNYRPEIDVLRMVAVVSVILFHFGYLENGYLGVDVFFAISGYLITGILYAEAAGGHLSLKQFYLRRTRRIIPLLLFVSLATLIAGIVWMLPDDLENLCQSIIATNFFSNNILLWLTSHNYWNLANEFKPLMHTWSLGVEEQFYLFFPFIFLLFRGARTRFVLPVLATMALVSLLLFLFSKDGGSKFYLIQYRFFELAAGGAAAIFGLRRKPQSQLQPVWLGLIALVLCFSVPIAQDLKLLIVTTASVAFLYLSGNSEPNPVFAGNRVGIFMGKISFSLYMWHQPVLAFTRYVSGWKISQWQAAIMLVSIFALSVGSYYFIEQPFRDRKRISTRLLLGSSFALGCALVILPLYIYAVNGVIRDVPELDEYQAAAKLKLFRKNEKNSDYNSRIYQLDKPFSSFRKTKVLVVGDSFARDWANVLFAMPGADSLELSYCVDLDHVPDAAERLSQADVVFFSELSKEGLDSLREKHTIDTAKVWNIGTKSFGVQNGVFYNRRHMAGYCNTHTTIDPYFMKRNDAQKMQWKNRYISLIGLLADSAARMPVFTPECKFMSEDGHHFTVPGAAFVARLVAGRHLLQTVNTRW